MDSRSHSHKQFAKRYSIFHEFSHALARNTNCFHLLPQLGKRPVDSPVERLLGQSDSSRNICDTHPIPEAHSNDQSILDGKPLQRSRYRVGGGAPLTVQLGDQSEIIRARGRFRVSKWLRSHIHWPHRRARGQLGEQRCQLAIRNRGSTDVVTTCTACSNRRPSRYTSVSIRTAVSPRRRAAAEGRHRPHRCTR